MDFYNSLEPHIIIVHNIAAFIAPLNAAEKNDLAALLEQSQLTGIHFIFVSAYQEYPRGIDKLPVALKSIIAGFTFMELKEVQMLPVPPAVTGKFKPLGSGEAYYILSGSCLRVKIPYVPMNG